MTNTRNTPVEALEHYLPVRLRRYKLRTGSGGPGAFRGGDGIVREFEFLAACRVNILSERRKFAPYGLRGGLPGRTGRTTLLSGGREIALGSKASTVVKAGDRLIIETPGGGGYGRPKRSKKGR